MEHPAYPSAETLSRYRRASKRADEIAEVNERVARILLHAQDEMLKLPDVASMAHGYDFSDMVSLLHDMMPDLSVEARYRLLARVAEEIATQGDDE